MAEDEVKACLLQMVTCKKINDIDMYRKKLQCRFMIINNLFHTMYSSTRETMYGIRLLYILISKRNKHCEILQLFT